jgi:hypothetical protein
MSDIKSVISFFIGLVLFVFIVFLALGRLRQPAKPGPNVTVILTLAPSPTISQNQPTKKLSLLDALKKIFVKKETVTPTLIPSPTLAQGLVKQISPTVILINDTPESGQSAVYAAGGIPNVYTIPETGNPTLLLPLAVVLGSVGMYLKKKK